MANLTHSNGHGTGTGNATLLSHPDLCTLQTCDLSMSSFLYRPTVVGNSLYAGIFALLLLLQLGFGIRYKTWGYMVAMIGGLALEIVGYVARVMIHNSPFDNNDFLIYLVCLTIAPALLTAAIYLTLARIINVYGEELSRFKPRTYTLVFCGCDLVSLVLQALGGAIASSSNTVSGTNLGKNLMLAGLIFQVVSLLLFAILCGEFAWRVMYFKSSWNPQYLSLVNSTKFKLFLGALAIGVVTIFARCVYRCVELSGGFNGTLFVSDEAVFMVLEGVMIVIATTGLTIFHPGLVFGQAWHDATFSFRQKKNEQLKNESSSELEMGALRGGSSQGRY